MKKISTISCLLLVALCSAQAFTYNGLEYSVKQPAGGTPYAIVEPSVISTYEGDIVIPSTVIDETGEVGTAGAEYTVHNIADACFSTTNITSIVLAETVDTIGAYAFQGCNQLTKMYWLGNPTMMVWATNSFYFSFTQNIVALYVKKDYYDTFKENYPSTLTLFGGGYFAIEEGAVSLTLTPTTSDDLTVEFSWFIVPNVTEYHLVVTEDDIPKWEYYFDEQGVKKLPALRRETDSTLDMGVISLGPLTAGASYSYTMHGTDAVQQDVYSTSGDFSISESTDGNISISQEADAIHTDLSTTQLPAQEQPTTRKVFRHGTLLIERGTEMYDMTGSKL